MRINSNSRIGQKFNSLIIIAIERIERRTFAICKCDCGNEITVRLDGLVDSNTKSCGCIRIKHGHNIDGKESSEYVSWRSMIQRCSNPETNGYYRYGGRGITVSERWLVFENFVADMGLKPDPLFTIERRDTNGNYEKNNCYWASREQQYKNKTNSRLVIYNGRTETLAQWSREFQIPETTLRRKIDKGMKLEDIVYA